MKTKNTTTVALAFAALLALPVSSVAAEYAERFVVSLAGFQPDGPAPFGAMVGLN